MTLTLTLYVRAVRYTAKLEDGTVFEKKGSEEELFEFVTDEGNFSSVVTLRFSLMMPPCVFYLA